MCFYQKISFKMNVKNILLAEDHNVVMMGTVQMLNNIVPDSIITCATNFKQALDLLKSQKFDLFILDINIPGGDQLTMLDSVRKIQPKVFILIFSAYDELLYAYPYLEAGANGFLSKISTEEEFKAAVERVMGGQRYLSQKMQLQSIEKLLNKEEASKNGLKMLSAREIEVMNLMVKGASTAEIGQRLFLQLSTVSTHKMRIFRKLNVENLVELIEYVRANKSNTSFDS